MSVVVVCLLELRNGGGAQLCKLLFHVAEVARDRKNSV